MKNKLLLTSALAGALIVTGSAYSETKISGSMVIAINSVSGPTGDASDSGFGRETQLDISNSGTLSNGMKYSAGFSMEHDGTDSGRAAGVLDSAENLRIIISSGDTSVGIGQDFMPNMSATAAPKVGTMVGTAAGAVRTTASKTATHLAYQNYPGDAFKNDMGVGLIQKFPVGSLSALYVPKINDNGGADGEPGDLAKENSGYELTFKGDLGVKGLNFISGYKKAEKDSSVTARATRDETAWQIGAGYNFGKVAIGFTHNDLEEGRANTERDSTDIGITFAASDTVSLGVNYTETDGKTTGTSYTGKEEIMMLAVGYNLGAVSLVAQYSEVDNIGGTNGSDGEAMQLRVSTKF